MRANQPWPTGSAEQRCTVCTNKYHILLTNTCRGLWEGVGLGGVMMISIKSEFWMENRRMKMSRRMSAGSKNVRGKKKEEEWEEAGDWEIFETTQCLLSVCLISVAHLKTGEGLHCATIQWGFLSRAVEGQLVARPCCGAPQEDNLSRSLFWPQFPAQQNDRLSDRARILITFLTPRHFLLP